MAEVQRYAREIVPTFNAYIYFRVGYSIARAVARFLYRVRLGFADERTMAGVAPGTTGNACVSSASSPRPVPTEGPGVSGDVGRSGCRGSPTGPRGGSCGGSWGGGTTGGAGAMGSSPSYGPESSGPSSRRGTFWPTKPF